MNVSPVFLDSSTHNLLSHKWFFPVCPFSLAVSQEMTILSQRWGLYLWKWCAILTPSYLVCEHHSAWLPVHTDVSCHTIGWIPLTKFPLIWICVSALLVCWRDNVSWCQSTAICTLGCPWSLWESYCMLLGIYTTGSSPGKTRVRSRYLSSLSGAKSMTR